MRKSYLLSEFTAGCTSLQCSQTFHLDGRGHPRSPHRTSGACTSARQPAGASYLEDLERGAAVPTLSDDQLTGVADRHGVRRPESVVSGQQVPHEAPGDRPLRHAVVVAVGHDHGTFAVDAQTARKLELPGAAALRAELAHELTATVEYLRVITTGSPLVIGVEDTED